MEAFRAALRAARVKFAGLMMLFLNDVVSELCSHRVGNRLAETVTTLKELMGMSMRVAAALAWSLLAFAAPAKAEIVAKTGTFSGMSVSYKVVLPNGYDPAKTYPAILAFAGGSQEMRIVDGVLENHFRKEAERRGYIVVIPAAPNGQLFFQGGARIFPAFLDQLLRDHRIEGGRFHIAGRSNGGLSAFHVASLHPRYFRSLTGFPGFLDGASNSGVEALRPLCIYMHVGENDPGWREAMKRQSDMLRQKGFRIRFTVEAGQGHSLETLAGAGAARLFDQLEEASRTCAS
jgi:poly(3-hydroxybutyrate) depolymerase